MGAVPWPVGLLVIILMIALAAHVVRTHQNTYWLWVIIAFPGLGALIYLFAVVVPEWSGGASARRMGKAARDAIDPGHAYRQAKAAYDDAPTVQNMMKLAEAACGMGRWAEAEELYAKAAQGFYAEDPALLLGRARTLVELGKPEEAVAPLDALRTQGTRLPEADLLRARAMQALGRPTEAERAYAAAVERMAGLEALARQAVFLAETGRQDEAKRILADIEQRTRKTQAHFRTEAKRWRDFAAAKIG
ncbi:MAG: tetratricopeptide repeat protein [Proteobacteria bacterium]|nr:tetratricopeptide repeat protein [Pseudomonadota bacterium]